MAETKISIKGLYKIFGEDPQMALEKVKGGMSKADLQAETGHVLGLSDINIDMKDGLTTVIMGLSGSGKSTLIRHVNRLIEPTAGEVWLDGENILDYTDEQLRQLRRKRMSMVFQNFALFPHRTVLENAGLALAVQGYDQSDFEDEARKWLSRVGLEGNADLFPHQLSGGMQQRVGIARALTSNSEIMLMDEAFSALDPLIRTDMQDLLLELQSELQKTVVFITHDLDEALKLADHLVILNEGQVIQQGEPQHILLNPADPYIEDFISDINRARVLRVRSVMREGPPRDGKTVAGEIDAENTLEDVIAEAEGAVDKVFRVRSGSDVVGTLEMPDLMKALVPAKASDEGVRAKMSA